MTLPLLSLYIHIPWCIHKCPYCDFNSHQVKSDIPEDLYIEHLIKDLNQDLKYVQGRKLSSIFIGGGTPSVFSSDGINYILDQTNKLIDFDSQIEITMEANPGTVDSDKFKSLIQTPVNRLSLGVQSFNDIQLEKLGRIHNGQQAIKAIKIAQDVGFDNINIDLMHGIPTQTLDTAIFDIEQAIALNTNHLSYYQLTIEPNTSFHSKPPILPKDELLEDIEFTGKQKLKQAGLIQYEVSAFAKPRKESKHNTNYWKFGDYIGVGCGAAGKVSLTGSIIRTVKTKHPRGYLQGRYTDQVNKVQNEDLPFEFFMNRFRLFEPCLKDEWYRLSRKQNYYSSIDSKIDELIKNGFIIETTNSWVLTDHGKLFLNDLLLVFLNE